MPHFASCGTICPFRNRCEHGPRRQMKTRRQVHHDLTMKPAEPRHSILDAGLFMGGLAIVSMMVIDRSASAPLHELHDIAAAMEQGIVPDPGAPSAASSETSGAATSATTNFHITLQGQGERSPAAMPDPDGGALKATPGKTWDKGIVRPESADESAADAG